MPSFGDRPAQPGWYPDPGGSPSHRYWDGSRWTDALSSAIPPAGPDIGRDDSRSWALAAHLSAPVGLIVALPFLGPLIVYLVKNGDPYVRRHAAEALNFNLSFVLYAVVVGLATLAGLVFFVRMLLLALLVFAWLALICIAAVKAGDGAAYRYPLTMRFVR